MTPIRCLSFSLSLCVVSSLVLGQSPDRAASSFLTAEDHVRIAAIRAQWAPALTVSDLIGLKTIGDQKFSPDKSYVAVVVNGGNLARNTIDSTLLIYRVSDLLTSPKPLATLQFASGSNNESAIEQPQWLSDDVIAFFGSRRGQVPQLYAFNLRTRRLQQLTHSPTRVGTFAVLNSGDLIYAADGPSSPLNEQSTDSIMRRRGVVVWPSALVFDVIKGDWQAVAEGPQYPKPIIRVVHGTKERTIRQLPISPLLSGQNAELTSWALRFAPSGDVALALYERKTERPWWETIWAAYKDGVLKRLFDEKLDPLWTWMVIDLSTGQTSQLMNAPVLSANTPVLWMPDGRSAVFVNSVLPLDSTEPAENAARAQQRMTAEIEIATGRVLSVITREPVPTFGAVERWDPQTATLILTPSDKNKKKSRLSFRKTASGWVTFSDAPIASTSTAPPVLQVKSEMNEPWKLVAIDQRTQKEHLAYDPNPGLLEKRRVAHVTKVHWQSKTGVGWGGTLYWPAQYVEGGRYPLLLQTHGATGGFAPNGWNTSGYAAQPLAGAGIFVLQMSVGGENKSAADDAPEREGSLHQEEIEGAIDYLDSLGLIDRSKVGVMGFSRTCYHVLYTLTHSGYPIAAATLTDGVDFGYLQWILFANRLSMVRTTNAINGGAPFGPALRTWLERAPTFSLDRVRAPVLITALNDDGVGPVRILTEWEPWAALVHQGKPAELVYIAEDAATHELVKPWQRFMSQQNCTVDWYRFWLQGYERKEPVPEAGETTEDLAKQYARWHKLREVQETNTKRQAPYAIAPTLK